MKTVIVWLRNDLRLHDHPALHAAMRSADQVVPVFILNKGILAGKHAGANRNRFLLESLEDLQQSFQKIGGSLIVRSGKPKVVLQELIQETGAEAVHFTTDYTPYARSRDGRVADALKTMDVAFEGHPGRLVVDTFQGVRAANGNIFKVFSPFSRSWAKLQRREILEAPTEIHTPSGLRSEPIDTIKESIDSQLLSPDVLPGGETAGRKRMHDFMKDGIMHYAQDRANMHPSGTSRFSPYLHFGCISPREVEDLLPAGDGPARFHRQLAWRDFYNYVILFYPHNAEQEFQERFRGMDWHYDEGLLQAWQEGRTGYPIVDAAMRQLNTEGWMHNRGRLIVGSFLTKDLQLDWRQGERYFMRMLMDGDEANNNGNWQWIASVGVDPAPVFRRLYNPMTQQKTYDPDGSYVRYYVPELKDVPDKYIAEPWKMSSQQQAQAGCIIGKDYPSPVVDHAAARKETLDRFRAAAIPKDSENV